MAAYRKPQTQIPQKECLCSLKVTVTHTVLPRWSGCSLFPIMLLLLSQSKTSPWPALSLYLCNPHSLQRPSLAAFWVHSVPISDVFSSGWPQWHTKHVSTHPLLLLLSSGHWLCFRSDFPGWREVKPPIISSSKLRKQQALNKYTVTDLSGWRSGPGYFLKKGFYS